MGGNKKDILVHTPSGFYRFEGISRKFTQKLYEWEKAQGIAPEESTFALLTNYYVPTIRSECNKGTIKLNNVSNEWINKYKTGQMVHKRKGVVNTNRVILKVNGKNIMQELIFLDLTKIYINHLLYVLPWN